MIEVKEETELYTALLAQFEKGDRKEASWLEPLRQAAIARFSDIGFPNTHDEEWRFTSLTPLTKIAFNLPDEERTIEASDLDRFTYDGWDCHRAVFINGRFSEALSQLGALPKGVRLGSLAVALDENPDWLEQHLARYAQFQDETFTALNTAFMREGALVYIPRNTVVEKPIHLLFFSTGEHPFVVHPRTLLIGEANSEARIVETYAGNEGGVYFTNAVTEIFADENANIDHYKVQQESLNAFHIANLQTHLERSAAVSTMTVTLGGSLVRNNVNSVLNGEGAESTLNGFFLVTGRQHVDNHTSIDHAKPHCRSWEMYKGILDGKARGVFNGRIIVRPDAQKTDSKQTNKNLLLSDEALVNTNPQLEIYADDVKCTHGATIGQLNADAVFYLRSRGIGHEEAKHLLTYAFASDLTSQIKVEPIRADLERLLFKRLAQG